jgi:hypothetical protein
MDLFYPWSQRWQQQRKKNHHSQDLSHHTKDQRKIEMEKKIIVEEEINPKKAKNCNRNK